MAASDKWLPKSHKTRRLVLLPRLKRCGRAAMSQTWNTTYEATCHVFRRFPLGSSIFAVWLFESLDVRRLSRSCNLGCPICVDICVTGTNMETGGQIHLGFLNPATCGMSFSLFLNGRGSSLWFWFQLSFICNWMKQTIKGGKKHFVDWFVPH